LLVVPATPAPISIFWVRKVRLRTLKCAKHSVNRMTIANFVDVEWLHETV